MYVCYCTVVSQLLCDWFQAIALGGAVVYVTRSDNIFLQTATGTGADPGFWERGGLINIFTTGGGGVSLP